MSYPSRHTQQGQQHKSTTLCNGNSSQELVICLPAGKAKFHRYEVFSNVGTLDVRSKLKQIIWNGLSCLLVKVIACQASQTALGPWTACLCKEGPRGDGIDRPGERGGGTVDRNIGDFLRCNFAVCCFCMQFMNSHASIIQIQRRSRGQFLA